MNENFIVNGNCTFSYNLNNIPLIFNRDIIVNGIYSSYGVYCLSKYVSEKLDYANGKKFAAISADYKGEDAIQIFLRSNIVRTDWVYSNYDKIMNSVKFIYIVPK